MTLATKEEIAAIKARRDKATPADWFEIASEYADGGVPLKLRGVQMYPEGQVPTGYGGWHADTNYPDGTPQGEQANADQSFIANAPADVRTLLSDREAMEGEIQQLRSQLPAEMRDCTILFKQCAEGHGWLTAANWNQHDCPTCERNALRISAAEKGKRIEELERLSPFSPGSCMVCGGQPLASGAECVCGGKGTMDEELRGLRIAALEAGEELAALRAQREWQSIETAPKDSTWILGLTQAKSWVVIRWGGGAWEDDNRLCRDPIQWQPLPPSEKG